MPLEEKIMRASSASQRTESSKAFLRSPFRRFENVTCRLVAFSILLIWVFPLTIFLFLLRKTPPGKNNKNKNRFLNATKGFQWRKRMEQKWKGRPKMETKCMINLMKETAKLNSWNGKGLISKKKKTATTKMANLEICFVLLF